MQLYPLSSRADKTESVLSRGIINFLLLTTSRSLKSHGWVLFHIHLKHELWVYVSSAKNINFLFSGAKICHNKNVNRKIWNVLRLFLSTLMLQYFPNTFISISIEGFCEKHGFFLTSFFILFWYVFYYNINNTNMILKIQCMKGIFTLFVVAYQLILSRTGFILHLFEKQPYSKYLVYRDKGKSVLLLEKRIFF